MQEITTHNVDLFLNRLKSALNITADAELALKIGVSAQTVSNWRARNSLPYDKAITLCLSNNIEINSLFTSKEYIPNNDFKKSNSVQETTPKYDPPKQLLEMNLIIFRQSKEIYNLKDRISELEGELKTLSIHVNNKS